VIASSRFAESAGTPIRLSLPRPIVCCILVLLAMRKISFGILLVVCLGSAEADTSRRSTDWDFYRPGASWRLASKDGECTFNVVGHRRIGERTATLVEMRRGHRRLISFLVRERGAWLKLGFQMDGRDWVSLEPIPIVRFGSGRPQKWSWEGRYHCADMHWDVEQSGPEVIHALGRAWPCTRVRIAQRSVTGGKIYVEQTWIHSKIGIVQISYGESKDPLTLVEFRSSSVLPSGD